MRKLVLKKILKGKKLEEMDCLGPLKGQKLNKKFKKYAEEIILENGFRNGDITFKEYVKSLNNNSIIPKDKLKKYLKYRNKMEKGII